jgi:hypothetical protein
MAKLYSTEVTFSQPKSILFIPGTLIKTSKSHWHGQNKHYIHNKLSVRRVSPNLSALKVSARVVVDGRAVSAAVCHASGLGLRPSQTYDHCGKIGFFWNPASRGASQALQLHCIVGLKLCSSQGLWRLRGGMTVGAEPWQVPGLTLKSKQLKA